MSEFNLREHLDLTDEVVPLVRRWVAEAARHKVEGSASLLAGLLRDPNGPAFTSGFVDGVVRPEDPVEAARVLAELAPQAPAFLPWYLKAGVRIGGWLGPVMPQVVVPMARRVLRGMVGHLLIDATDRRLGAAIAKLRQPGIRLNVNLLGEAVLGEAEARRRLDGTRALVARPDVDYVSIKVSSVTAPHNPWATSVAADEAIDALLPLFQQAAAKRPAAFINLDMEEYKDLDLTIEVFTRLLDRPEFLNYSAGIVLQAYLPDSLAAMIRLQEWSAARVRRGGAPIKVRLVKGANLLMERVEAELHGWPLATWGSKQDVDTNYLRILDYALRPQRTANVRLGVAGHNLFDVAHTWLLAGRRGVREAIDIEMLLGMAPGQVEAIRAEVGGVLIYTPVVHPAEFDVAVSYLVRRLDEGAASENFMSAVFELDTDAVLFDRERDRYRASVKGLDAEVPVPNRVADRYAAVPAPALGAFVNTPDTDPAVASNREWVDAILTRVPSTTLGREATAAARVPDAGSLDALIARTSAAASGWAARPAAERAAILHAAGAELERRRGDLLEIMAAEAGKTVDQGDPEVSEAIDFAHFYADQALTLEQVDGARFTPAGVIAVIPPWNFPVAIPAGGVLAALAAGSAVVFKPAKLTQRCGAVVAEALWAAGVPSDVLALVDLADHDLGRQLVSDERIERVILTGSIETAELFRSFRPDLRLLGETSGKNAIIVTPSADLDLAVRDVIASAFGHAGQKCSAASLVVLVGSVARSERFRRQLVDAAASFTVGVPTDVTSRMGPIIEPAKGKLLRGLTTLGEGESWLIEPRKLDEAGMLWSPGVREGVRRGSEYHLVEYFGPILGVMTADTLAEAIDIVNDVDYGLTSGLHSLNPAEIAQWVDGIQAGNLYINRGITGAIVRRQPFGGWKASAVGAGTKAGGPSYEFALGSWRTDTATQAGPIGTEARRVLAAAKRALGADAAARLERALGSDAHALATAFAASDVSGLVCERNVLRYLPVSEPVQLRLAADGDPADLLRVVAAALAARAPFAVSSAVDLPAGVDAALPVPCKVSSDEAWFADVRASRATRVRLVGGDASALARACEGRVSLAVWADPVTEAGRVELLPFLHEQAVSMTAHRFGSPTPLVNVLD